jgi:hypothetical protein
MSELFALASVLAVGYFGVGLAVLGLHDRAVGGDVIRPPEAARIIVGWPVIGFVVIAGLYALWATQREVEKL